MSRRRKMNAINQGGAFLDYGKQEDRQNRQEPAEVNVPEVPKPKDKGICRHCGEYIERGVHFHERRCMNEYTNGAKS